jgi:hypothetical protein
MKKPGVTRLFVVATVAAGLALDDNFRPNLDVVVEVDHVFVCKTDAAG